MHEEFGDISRNSISFYETNVFTVGEILEETKGKIII